MLAGRQLVQMVFPFGKGGEENPSVEGEPLGSAASQRGQRAGDQSL
jgi:hypothetical protein